MRAILIRGRKWERMVGLMPMSFPIICAKKAGHLRDMAVIPNGVGKNGPLHVTRGKRDNPLVTAFVEAGVQAGYEATADYNGQKQEGFGPMEQTIHHGERWSAAKALSAPSSENGPREVDQRTGGKN
jgi:choline dehydrogenase-like flavoprotein